VLLPLFLLLLRWVLWLSRPGPAFLQQLLLLLLQQLADQ
jgi:hypothetical protein